MITQTELPESLAALLGDEEELHHDLEPYMFNGPFGEGIKHPLVFSIPHSPLLNRITNERYLAKQEGLEKALEEKEWNRAIWLHERPYRFEALESIWSRITRDRTKAELFMEVWTDSENLWQVRDIWEDMAREIDIEHFHAAMSDDDQEVLDSLSFPLEVYRGGDPAYEQGLSYSLDRGKAEWFAARYGEDGELFTTTLESVDDVLFYYGDRGESEIVIHPDSAW